MTSAREACFEPEPPTPRNKTAGGPDIQLPYTHIWTELIKLGVTWNEAMRMPWSVCRMMFEARAEAYEAARSKKSGDAPEEVRYATQDDIDNWI